MSNGEAHARCVRTGLCVLSIVACSIATATRAQLAEAPRPEPIPLRDGQRLTASHDAAEPFVYVVSALEGRTYLIEVEQRGLDLILTLEMPDGTTQSFDSPLLRDEREVVLLEDTVAGSYVITMRSDEHTGATGGHAIGLAELTAAPADAAIEAWRLMARGGAANFAAGADSWRAAAAAYQAAAELWQALGRARERAQALFAVAALEYWRFYGWQRCAELASAAAELYGDLDEATLAANALHLQGAALVERALETTQSAGLSKSPTADALFDDALALLEQARMIHERLGNVYELGLVVNNLGYTHYNRGAFDEARTHWQRAVVLMRNTDEWAGELNSISNLAAVEVEQGNVADAIDSFERTIDILPPGKVERYRAATLDNLGASHLIFGNAEQSLQAFSAALAIQRDIEDLQGQGRSLRGIGTTYYGLGELDLAKAYLQQALPIARQTNDGRNREGILRDLGNIAFLERDYTAALALHRQALDIVNSSADRAYLQLLVAKDLIALGGDEAAQSIATQVRAAAEQSGSELLLADALHKLGRAQLHGPDARLAIDHLEQAARTYERLDLQAHHAEVLHSLALAARGQGRLQQAADYGEASLTRLESLRVRVADPELRAFFSSIRRNYYETQIGLLMELHSGAGDSEHYLHAALDASERARARMIADLLQEASIDLRFDIDPELGRRQTELYERLAERSRQRDKLLEQGLEETAAGDPLTAVLADIASIENQLNLLEIEFRGASPEFASLNPPKALTVPQIQELLDRDSVLLQYAFTDRASYVWVLSRDTVTAVELADRATIEAAARRVVEGLQTYAPTESARQAMGEDLRALAALVLEPVAQHIDRPRVVLSLDGALQYVPFSVLPLRQRDGFERRLLEAHRVVRVPSMSALAALRTRADGARARKTLAVFADPVLGADDPRLGATVTLAAHATAAAGRNGARPELSTGSELQRLPWTGREARAIAALVPDDHLFVAEGFGASRSAVFHTDLSQYRYLHFATHGVVDSRHPALSSLALSQFDERGMAQEGFLRLHDIYGLKLNADLVVLSACETALGSDVRGEGLLGLSQGFMYAGARALVASLWQVPDRATQELMKNFYRFMLHEQLDPAEALRRAQLASASEQRWSDPYFWGGFVLLGDWQ